MLVFCVFPITILFPEIIGISKAFFPIIPISSDIPDDAAFNRFSDSGTWL